MPQTEEQIMFDRMKTPFICTYDSCKGLEFDIVIMPFFNDAANALSRQRRKRNNDGSYSYEFNFDGSPKMWATRNHYYVGATRARTQLYLLCYQKPQLLIDLLEFISSNNQSQINLFDDDLPF